MSSISRSIDDLDRLAFRLSRTIRTQYPQLLTQGFTLGDLEERLLPYRDARREMADNGADTFETAVLRLLAGERGYLLAERELQEACRQALSFPSPTLAMVRAWATSPLRLGQTNGVAGDAETVAAGVSGAAPAPVPTGEPGAGPRAAAPRDTCRYCAAALPQGRAITFCPFCGMDLTKRQCPACSTELDAEWRFCVTCGRRE